MKQELTYGQKLVGATFNPSNNEAVDTIKARAAELIDIIKAADGDGRATSLAVTHIETASMFAVKAQFAGR